MFMKQSSYAIGVIGLWHLGEIFSAGLAELGHHVIGIGDDAVTVTNLNQGIPPVVEPGLPELIKKNLEAGRLSYTTEYRRLRQCNVFWMTLDTPVNDRLVINIRPLFTVLDRALPYARNDLLLVVSSQIPVGTSAALINHVRQTRPRLRFRYVHTPENLRLGEAVGCFFNPARIVIGTDSAAALDHMRAIFQSIPVELLAMAPASAELGKHALNAYLATSISLANELGDIAERVGADMSDISHVLRSDPRIGPRAYVGAGLSFSGWSLVRDLKVLMQLVKKFKLHPSVVAAGYARNEARKKMVVQRLQQLLGTVRGKTIAIFGIAYKAGTATLRHSYPLAVAEELAHCGARVVLHDPFVISPDPSLLKNRIEYNPYRAAAGADAIVIMASCPSFQKLNFKRLASQAQPRAILFDGSNMFYRQEASIRQAGFRYCGIGRSVNTKQL